jgi:hypothetical protein
MITTLPAFNVKRVLVTSGLAVRLSRPRELLLVVLVSIAAGMVTQTLVLSTRTTLDIVLPGRLLLVAIAARSQMVLLTSSASAWSVFGTVRRRLDPVLLLLYGLLVLLELLVVPELLVALAPRRLLVPPPRRLLVLVASSRLSLVLLLGLSWLPVLGIRLLATVSLPCVVKRAWNMALVLGLLQRPLRVALVVALGTVLVLLVSGLFVSAPLLLVRSLLARLAVFAPRVSRRKTSILLRSS